MDIRVAEASWPQDGVTVEALFREYVASLGVDISFQNVDEELSALPGKYARPGGLVLIAWDDAQAAGAVAYRMFKPGIAEMKRLYVRPAFRGRDIGRKLASHLIADARAQGYRTMLLDTLASMQAARALYAELGFQPVEAYYDNPLPDTVYMALALGK